MRFSSENQPASRRRPSGNARETFSVRLTREAIEYYREHRGEAGRVLEANAKRRTPEK